MQELQPIASDRRVRRFSSHAEQEAETQRFWSTQTTQEKFKAVAELAQHFSSIHGIDIHAQGPKRLVVRFERSRS